VLARALQTFNLEGIGDARALSLTAHHRRLQAILVAA